MRPLTDVTLIIPVRMDSPDRAFNLHYVVSYLTHHFNTHIIIKESDTIRRVPEILGNLIHRKTIQYQYEECADGLFHRTRIINEMLSMVTTPVVANYDIDVVLRPAAFMEARNMILWEGYDLVYPFFKGFSQYRITRDVLAQQQDITTIPLAELDNKYSFCGFCQFLNTESYRAAGMQNEQFLSWGPEDREFLYRMEQMGYRITWLNHDVFHIEHERGRNSGTDNPHFQDNEALFQRIQEMNGQQLREYYQNADYLAKYR